MLDVRLFTDRRFSAASGAVMITFFSLAGFIFLITQYFQLVRGYDPLSTGARIIPVAVSIAVASVAGGLLAPRVGTASVVTTGLVMFGGAMAWISTATVDTPYATTIVAQMVLMGLGMGLISPRPPSRSCSCCLRPGPASARPSTTPPASSARPWAWRSSGRCSRRSTAPRSPTVRSRTLPAARVEEAKDSVAVAVGMARVDPALLSAAQDSFMDGLHVACLLVAAVCFAGAIAAVFALPGRKFVARATAEAQAEEREPANIGG